MPRVDVSVVMNAPAQEVWSAVADVLSYPQFMQNVHEVTLLEELPGRQHGHVVVGVPQGLHPGMDRA